MSSSSGYETASKRTRTGNERSGLSLSAESLLGLFYIQRYRFLTIGQYARIASLNHDTATKQLRRFEERGLLGYFGNTGIRGYGKTPKVYFLTRKGFELLRRESEIPPELIGNYKEVKVESRWSPQMYHRLRTVDLMISAECAVKKRPQLSMVATFLEYLRVRRGNHVTRETTDYVAGEETAENRIIPDAALILENIETKKRALFFVEMDMATEPIVSRITRDTRHTIQQKLRQYDRYLKSLRYKETYAAYGDFRSFTLLFVTLSAERVNNIRRDMQELPAELSNYYRFTTFEAAMGDFFSTIWNSRSLADTTVYSLVRDERQMQGGFLWPLGPRFFPIGR
jgi:DNA-binding MarR family transcriptional regulator